MVFMSVLVGLTKSNLLRSVDSLKPTNNSELRRITGEPSVYLETINGYGCWCYFDENWTKAKGKAQDSIDKECQQLIKGYRCLNLEYPDCDVMSFDYVPYIVV